MHHFGTCPFECLLHFGSQYWPNWHSTSFVWRVTPLYRVSYTPYRASDALLWQAMPLPRIRLWYTPPRYCFRPRTSWLSGSISPLCERVGTANSSGLSGSCVHWWSTSCLPMCPSPTSRLAKGPFQCAALCAPKQAVPGASRAVVATNSPSWDPGAGVLFWFRLAWGHKKPGKGISAMLLSWTPRDGVVQPRACTWSSCCRQHGGGCFTPPSTTVLQMPTALQCQTSLPYGGPGRADKGHAGRAAFTGRGPWGGGSPSPSQYQDMA